MLVKTYCAEVMGLEATPVTTEVNITRGVMFHLSGCPVQKHEFILSAHSTWMLRNQIFRQVKIKI